ncbi:MAG: VTT domain-containing protein [Bacillota bacterium]
MYKKIAGLLALLIVVSFFYSTGIIQALIIGDMQKIQNFLDQWGIFAPLGSISLILLQAFVAPIPAVFIYIANGIIFGALGGLIVSWIGSLISAYLCFALVRYFGLNMQIKNEFLRKIMGFLERYQEKAVFVVRLMPFIPADLASYAFGFTLIKARYYVIGTALGQTPAILFYSLWGGMKLPMLYNILAIAVWAALVLGGLKIFEGFRKKNAFQELNSKGNNFTTHENGI